MNNIHATFDNDHLDINVSTSTHLYKVVHVVG